MTEQKSTVLIIDDEPSNIEILNAVLEGECDVLFATSGEDGLALVQSERPDLILLDVMMPDMDGYEVIGRLKGEPDLKDIPVIFVTARSEESDEARGLEAGAIDYIIKPISAPIVRMRVRNHLELKRYRDLLQDLSIRDGLTGLPNRRRYDEFMEQEWARARRNETPLSVILMDIDHFKQFNDTYGHAAGDDCLQKVGAALKEVVRRPADLVARYGGEEFVCVLPDTDSEGATQVAEAVREAVSALGIPHAHSSAADHVTMSLGVATMIPQGEVPPGIIAEKADVYLYEAKEAGRNRVIAGTV
ncbi:MAG: PleD family two-component system response regulator [Rhodospirillales bacterium]|nr:PleD family two-component system response regulator [Rhodospirillales bacterium]